MGACIAALCRGRLRVNGHLAEAFVCYDTSAEADWLSDVLWHRDFTCLRAGRLCDNDTSAVAV